MIYPLLAVAAIGHVILWAAIVNRLHGLGIERRSIDVATAACALAMAVIPLPIAWLVWQHVQGQPVLGGQLSWNLAMGYAFFCGLNAFVSAAKWLRHTFDAERRGALLANHTTRVDLRKTAGAPLTAPGIPSWLGRVPGNQLVDLHVHEKRLAIPRLPAGSSEIRIVHLSDFHMSGRLDKKYYRAVVDRANRLDPDVIAITGDLVERNHCLDWLPDTLGKLRAPAGVFFVRGNHDRRVHQERLLAGLTQLGLVHLDGSVRHVTIRDTPILLAGNELPWFGAAPDLSKASPRDTTGLPLRVLLAHGPDQFGWAQAHDVDLILAGHNHGGQVCLPVIGAILAPSLSGTRYASGVFRRGNTVLHVSRGSGSLFPFRWNCPPEVALLRLCPATS